MRDGINRREEYEADRVGTLVFLETAAGRFVILPQARLYASTSEMNNDEATEPSLAPETMSPDFLLNESTVSSEYQKLGEEVRAGRMTTKYRVINRSGDASITSETLIWIDETLGMPIASESLTTNANGTNRVSMELREISTEVESGVFAAPADYRKVELTQIFSLVRGTPETGRPSAGK